MGKWSAILHDITNNVNAINARRWVYETWHRESAYVGVVKSCRTLLAANNYIKLDSLVIPSIVSALQKVGKAEKKEKKRGWNELQKWGEMTKKALCSPNFLSNDRPNYRPLHQYSWKVAKMGEPAHDRQC